MLEYCNYLQDKRIECVNKLSEDIELILMAFSFWHVSIHHLSYAIVELYQVGSVKED
jgi:hypothetical protein